MTLANPALTAARDSADSHMGSSVAPDSEVFVREDAATCIQRAVAFDGIAPLSYATVAAPAGTQVYLHAQFPAQCASDAGAHCRSPTYVLSGDVVAVGKTCGAWAYVQYIGERHITKGWLSVADLGTPQTLAPRTAAVGNPPAEPVFELTRGKNVPVCEAYLQRLNQTQFNQPAYCGRPEDDRVPGFKRLQRMMLSASDVERLGALVEKEALMSAPTQYKYLTVETLSTATTRGQGGWNEQCDGSLQHAELDDAGSLTGKSGSFS